jgi:hypothetical protein
VHASGEARRFYEELAAPALIGMEARATTGGLCGWLRILRPAKKSAGPHDDKIFVEEGACPYLTLHSKVLDHDPRLALLSI